MDKEVETDVKLKENSPSLTSSSSMSQDPESVRDTQVMVTNFIDSDNIEKDEPIFINGKNKEYQRKRENIAEKDSANKDCNEEEVSLLDGNRASKSPRQKLMSTNKNETHSDSQMVGKPNQDTRTSTQYADIQLAEVETITEKNRKSMDQKPSKVLNSSHQKYQISSLQTLCGPNPAKISTICVIVLSVWAAGMMLFHLNKKIDVLTTNMAETHENIKSMEDSQRAFRSFSSQREMRIQKRLTKILHSIRSDDTNNQISSPSLPNLQPKEEDFTNAPGVEVVDIDDW